MPSAFGPMGTKFGHRWAKEEPEAPPPTPPNIKPKHSKVTDLLPPPKGGKTSKIGRKFGRCVKAVRKTVKSRKGSTTEAAAIAICTKSVLQTRGKTLKRYRKGRLTTQKKFRGGDLAVDAKNIIDKISAVPLPEYTETKLVQIPEAKGSPAVDDMIQKLKDIQDSKSLMKKVVQAVGRQGMPGHTAELVRSLEQLKETGQFTLYHDTPVRKLKALYPMV